VVIFLNPQLARRRVSADLTANIHTVLFYYSLALELSLNFFIFIASEDGATGVTSYLHKKWVVHDNKLTQAEINKYREEYKKTFFFKLDFSTGQITRHDGGYNSIFDSGSSDGIDRHDISKGLKSDAVSISYNARYLLWRGDGPHPIKSQIKEWQMEYARNQGVAGESFFSFGSITRDCRNGVRARLKYNAVVVIQAVARRLLTRQFSFEKDAAIFIQKFQRSCSAKKKVSTARSRSNAASLITGFFRKWMEEKKKNANGGGIGQEYLAPMRGEGRNDEANATEVEIRVANNDDAGDDGGKNDDEGLAKEGEESGVVLVGSLDESDQNKPGSASDNRLITGGYTSANEEGYGDIGGDSTLFETDDDGSGDDVTDKEDEVATLQARVKELGESSTKSKAELLRAIEKINTDKQSLEARIEEEREASRESLTTANTAINTAQNRLVIAEEINNRSRGERSELRESLARANTELNTAQTSLADAEDINNRIRGERNEFRESLSTANAATDTVRTNLISKSTDLVSSERIRCNLEHINHKLNSEKRKLKVHAANQRLENEKLEARAAGQRLENKRLEVHAADQRLENKRLNARAADQRCEHAAQRYEYRQKNDSLEDNLAKVKSQVFMHRIAVVVLAFLLLAFGSPTKVNQTYEYAFGFLTSKGMLNTTDGSSPANAGEAVLVVSEFERAMSGGICLDSEAVWSDYIGLDSEAGPGAATVGMSGVVSNHTDPSYGGSADTCGGTFSATAEDSSDNNGVADCDIVESSPNSERVLEVVHKIRGSHYASPIHGTPLRRTVSPMSSECELYSNVTMPLNDYEMFISSSIMFASFSAKMKSSAGNGNPSRAMCVFELLNTTDGSSPVNAGEAVLVVSEFERAMSGGICLDSEAVCTTHIKLTLPPPSEGNENRRKLFEGNSSIFIAASAVIGLLGKLLQSCFPEALGRDRSDQRNSVSSQPPSPPTADISIATENNLVRVGLDQHNGRSGTCPPPTPLPEQEHDRTPVNNLDEKNPRSFLEAGGVVFPVKSYAGECNLLL